MSELYLPDGTTHPVGRPPVLIGIPMLDMGVLPQPFGAFMGLQRQAGDTVLTIIGHVVHQARNVLAASLFKSEFDWLLMLDSDMVMPPDTIDKLLHHNQPLVSGLYFNKRLPYGPVAYNFERLGDDGWPLYRPIDGWQEGATFEVDAVGAGCLLVHRSVLEKLPVPWFQFPPGRLSEDMYFSWQARQAGIPILLDTSVLCGHTAALTVTQDNYKAVRRQVP